MDMTVKIMRQFEKEFEESHAVFFVSADTHKMHTENVKCQVDAGFNSLRFKTLPGIAASFGCDPEPSTTAALSSRDAPRPGFTDAALE